MSFLETPRFPESISFGAVGGPGYSTSVIVVQSGAEQRNIDWAQARCRWDVSQAVKKSADFELAANFFRVVKGRAHGFRFKDFADFEAGSAQGILTVIAANTTWQMYKRYTSGALTEDRLISKPVIGTINITGSGSYTVDYTTGIVTRVSGANPSAWAGQFDVPARFDTDVMRAEIVSRSGNGFLLGWASIPIVEIRT